MELIAVDETGPLFAPELAPGIPPEEPERD